MSEPFSFDEFKTLVSQFQTTDSSEESVLSSENIQKLDSMTRYFYLQEKESNNNEDDSEKKKLINQTILDSAYNLMNIYQNSLQVLANSFSVEYSANAKDIINGISQQIKIDPSQNLIQQILSKVQGDKKNDDDSFEVPGAALDKQIMKNNEYKERIDVLEAKLREERKAKGEISDELHKLKAKVITLERTIGDQETEILLQKAKIDSNDEIYLPQQEQLLSLKKSLIESTNKIESQERNLEQLMKQRQELHETTIKQSEEINQLKKQLEMSAPKEESIIDTSLVDQDQNYSNNLFDKILEIAATISSSCVDNITDIIHYDYGKSDYDKVIEITTALIDDIRAKQDIINKLQSSISSPAVINTTNNSNDDSVSIEDSPLLVKLADALNNESMFISKIISSKDELGILKPDLKNPDEFRATLLSNVAQIHEFLEKNCKFIIEDNREVDLFNTLSFKGDPLKLNEELKAYLDSYPSMITDEGRAMMSLFKHSVAAISITSYYSSEILNQYKLSLKISKENKDMVMQLEEEERELSDELSETKETFENMQNVIRKTMNILKSAVLRLNANNGFTTPFEDNDDYLQDLPNDENEDEEEIIASQSYALKSVIEAIECLREFHDVDDKEYNESIEQRLIEALYKLEESEKLRLDSESEFNLSSQNLREQLFKDSHKYKSEYEKQKLQYEKSLDEIKQLKSDVQILTENLNESHRAYQDLQSQLSKSKSNVVSRDVSLVQQPDLESDSLNLDDLSSSPNTAEPSDYLKKLETKFQRKMVALHVHEKEKRSALKKKLHKLRDEYEALVSQLNEKERNIKILQATQDQLLAEQKSRSVKQREADIQEQKNIAKLKAQYNEMSIKLATSDMARKMAEQELKSLEEKTLRKENEAESIKEVLKQEYNTRLEERTNSIRDECNAKHNDFVKQIVQEFRTCFDILPSITSSPSKIAFSPNKGQFVIGSGINSTNVAALEEVVMKLVKTATDSIKYYTSEKKKTKKQLKELQVLFNVSSPLPAEITKAANQYIKDINAQIESLQKQLLTKSKNSYVAPGTNVVTQVGKPKTMTVNDWENWARKLYMWSNKGSTKLLPISSIMRNVEEAIFEYSGYHDKISTTLDNLRIQKQIVLEAENKDEIEMLFNRNSIPTNVNSILFLIRFVKKLQRLSGNLPSNMGIKAKTSTFSDFEEDVKKDEEFPSDNEEVEEKSNDDLNDQIEIDQKLQNAENQENSVKDDSEIAAIDNFVEEEEEDNNKTDGGQDNNNSQIEHGEEQ